MSGLPSPHRFRIRLDGGTELPVSTVEALARRLERGDLLPDTPMHDSSTGLWVRASESPVVRFILEEMWRSGEEPPPAWAPTEIGSEGTGAGSGVADNAIEGAPPAASPEAAAAAADEIEVAGLSRTMLPDSSLDDFFTEPPPGTGTHSDRVSDALPDSDAMPDMGMTLVPPSDAEGGEAEDIVRRIEAIRPDVRLEKSEWIERPDAGELRRGSAERAPVDAGSRPGRAVAFPPTKGSRRRVLPRVLILAAGVTFGALLILDRTEEPATLDSLGWGGGLGTSPPTQPQLSAPAAAPVPAGLEVPVSEALGAFERVIQGLVDSLSTEHGVAGAPPPPWLGGRYLSSAGAYPEVRSFWEGYRRMVDDLRLLDRAVFDGVLRDAIARVSDREEDALRIERHLEARYAAMQGRREDRYRQLVAAAERAIDLHEFLVASEASLRFTPALGSTVPLDPVLEVGTDSPEVLQSLNTHLDELFRALDRSRGGGALSQGGLRSELFLGFGAL